MKFKKRTIILATVFALLLILVIGPLDVFVHGYYCEMVNYDQIDTSDFMGQINLDESGIEISFMPIKDHFAGFEIILKDQPDDNTGSLTLTISDNHLKVLDIINIDLSKVKENLRYKVYTNKALHKSKVYTLHITAINCKSYPALHLIDSDYLTEEQTSSDILIGFAYAESTFNFQDKVMIIIFVIAIWGFLCTKLITSTQKHVLILRYVSIYLLLTSILSWNYMNNSMDTGNKGFDNFQSDSENLVTGTLKAEENGIDVAKIRYGLGMYMNIEGKHQFQESLITDDNWKNGYSNWSPSICIDSNDYTQELVKYCNYIQFANGDTFQITDIIDDGNNINISLNAERLLTESKYGKLINAQFFNSDMEKLPSGLLTAYASQYGLQGKVFRHLARYMNDNNAISNLKLICAVTTSAVFVLIIFLVSFKYNILFAGCFFITFWLSPWIINFARNLYWVEFTWFVPMVIGLFCAWKINSKKCRVLSHIAAFLAILLKCLCGYEYITNIMLGLILFLLADFIMACIYKNKDQQKLLFKTIFIMGIVALNGFVLALCIHSYLRGNGHILEGLIRIYNEDVLRRTYGADLNMYDENLLLSINSSAWEVICQYFHFQSQIITGIDGNLFPLLCITPLIIFIEQQVKNKLNVEFVILYIIFFFTSISWFFLAKAHSYVHTHMNYVLWYMGYVQICLYIIINWTINKITTRR